jgi:hypothetical protein
VVILYEPPLSYHWSDPPDDELGYTDLMEFRLVYEGPLLAASNSNTRVREKHQIRKQLHRQLKELWAEHPALEQFWDVLQTPPDFPPPSGGESKQSADFLDSVARFAWSLADMQLPGDRDCHYIESLARRFVRSNGYRFVPLVNKELDLICGLDILFLRRENPGNLVSNSGDVDNRIKTLLDALKVPEDGGELLKSPPSEDEQPFYCLLEDDKLVTELNIKTDRLLTPVRPNGHENEVVLILQVKLSAATYNHYNRRLVL